MAKTINDAIEAVQAIALAIDGINHAPAKPAEAANVWPFVFTYCSPMRWEGQGGDNWVEGHHTIVSELHVPRTNLAVALGIIWPLADSFAKALIADSTLSGTVDTITDPTATFEAVLNYVGTPTAGIKFSMEIKQRLAIV
jgi:hypothetical protein